MFRAAALSLGLAFPVLLNAQIVALDPTFGNGDGRAELTPVNVTGRDIALLSDGRIACVGQNYASMTVSVFVLNTDGTPDLSFSTNGVDTVPFPGTADLVDMLAVQPDDAILLAGTTSVNGTYRLTVARLLPSGGLDPSFGTNGVFTFTGTQLGGRAYAITVQADGRILVAGALGGVFSTIQGDLIILRLLPNGTLDPSFGDGGTVIFPPAPSDFLPAAIHALPDGRILAAVGNFGTCRLEADGTPDGTYGSGDGFASTIFDWDGWTNSGRMTVLPDGGMLFTGVAEVDGSGLHAALFQATTNAEPDGTFGTDGLVHYVPTGSSGSTYLGACLDPQERIVGLRLASVGELARSELTRYSPDGTLDATFGPGGIHVTEEIGRAMECQPDGRVLVLGSLNGYVLSRYLTDTNVGIAPLAEEAPTVRTGPDHVEIVPPPRITGPWRWRLADAQGRALRSGLSTDTRPLTIPLHDLATGIYHVTLQTRQGTLTARFTAP